MRFLLKNYPYVKLYSIVPSQGSRLDTIIYAQDLPKDAKYEIEITNFPIHTSRRVGKITHTHIGSGKKRNNQKTMFSCIRVSTYDSYGKHVGFRGGSSSSSNLGVFPSRLDCDRCEWSCKRGWMVSPVDYCLFLGYGCRACGFKYEGYYQFGSPCKRCGSDSVVSLTKGENPHIHGKYYVFQLHILNHSVAVTLGEFLGVSFDDQLCYSCVGSWYNFRNDSSGFDVCYVNSLNDLIETRIRQNLKGVDLFMYLYPKEGKVLLGNNKIIKYWVDGELRPVSEYFSNRGKKVPSRYFSRKGLGVPVKKI